MNRLDKIIEILQLRLESLDLAVKHNAANGDYDRAAVAKIRASEVFDILQELSRQRESVMKDSIHTVHKNHDGALQKLTDS